MRLQTLWLIGKETIAQWSKDRAPTLGAALAYYTAFSIGPLLVVVIAVAGLVFGQGAVRGQVAGALTSLLGDAGAKGVDVLLAEASKPQQGLWATVVSAVTLLLGATGVVVQLKSALNAIWNVEPKSGGGLWQFLRTYVVSLAGLLALAFLLMISLVVGAMISAFGGLFVSAVGETIAQVANQALSFAVVAVLFAMMFKWLPDVDVAWRDVWIGALLTAALFTLGKFLIGLYLGGRSMESAFGAAASLAALLVWVYYSAQIVFLGAEFTQVYSRRDKLFADEQPAVAPTITPSASRNAWRTLGDIALAFALTRLRKRRSA